MTTPDDAEQLRLDLDDARARLDAIRRAIQKRDDAEADIRRLKAELRQAQRRAKEAGWDVTTLLSRERREGKPR